MEEEDLKSFHASEIHKLRDQVENYSQRLTRAQTEAQDLRYHLAKTQEDLAVAQRRNRELQGASREVGADQAELVRRNRELIHEILQLKEQRRGQGGLSEQFYQEQLEEYKRSFQHEREDKEKAQAIVRQLRQEIETRGRGGDNALLELQMNEFRKEFQSEREDKLKAQANARQLKLDKDQLRELQDKMQTQIINLEQERNDLQKIIEILQADMGGAAQANNPQPQAANPVPVPNPIPNAAPNPVPNPI
ncbi:hypothetical protein EMCRGX_G006621 [Ephydatia muelleri]